MKILIFSDVHWSTYTSIVRSRAEKYSTRLDLLIKSMNWVNDIALKNDCEAMICAGDFFDRAQCTDEELTAIRDIKWNNLPCYFLCGNHESSRADLSFSSLKALETCSAKRYVISDSEWSLKFGKTQVHFVPYVVESDRLALDNYLNKAADCDKHVVISHNDIAGINYGGFESKLGFSTEEIEQNCDLYLNGHLHNSEWITNKILNVGSFSAHNFTNDSLNYKYGIWVLDTDTLNIEFIRNPYSLSFYKFEVSGENDLDKLKTINKNSVLSIKCNEDFLNICKQVLECNKENIIESRITVVKNIKVMDTSVIVSLQGQDHITRLAQFCKETLDNSKILDEELAEICK